MTREQALQLAVEAGLEAPRVMRLNGPKGHLDWVLRFGPDDNRKSVAVVRELELDKKDKSAVNADDQAIRQAIEQAKSM